MRSIRILMSLFFILVSSSLSASSKSIERFESESRIWEEGFPVHQSRENVYGLEPKELKEAIDRGRQYFFEYPVQVTGATIPLNLFDRVYRERPWHPFSVLFRSILSLTTGKSGENAVYQYLELTQLTKANNYLNLPFPKHPKANNYLGASIIKTKHGEGLTFSCAACHVQNLFGKPVLGLANRFPTANDFLLRGKMLIDTVRPESFVLFLGRDADSIEQLRDLRKNMKFVDGKKPKHKSLDTSLAQVGLSLAKRKPDAFATKEKQYADNPRASWHDRNSADSKPMPWWNLKYKNRWLSDGSVVSGNPIYTNLIWNEIGRGSSMRQLGEWVDANMDPIRDMTTAVFATPAPRYEEFFSYKRISISKAKAGEEVFNRNCASCHGTYEKAWKAMEERNSYLSFEDYRRLIQTTKFTYHVQTPVIDVGTDPYRAQGMDDFAEGLNRLEISKKNGVIVKPQRGYVPPPLVGIWARWPYLHNNSIPNLCVLLTPESKRPKSYWAGPAINQERDYDHDCVGYPTGRSVPRAWKRDRSNQFHADKRGLRNIGHSEGILIRNGKEILSAIEKQNLMEYLKTL